MKYNKLKIALSALALLGLAACTDDDVLSQYDISTSAMNIRVSNYIIQFDNSNNWEKSNTVYYFNATWKTEGLPSWISQTPLSGGGSGEGYNDITYNTKDNKSNLARTAYVKIIGTSTQDGTQKEKIVAISQSASAVFFHLYDDNNSDKEYKNGYTYIVEGGAMQTIKFKVSTNADCTLSTNDSWITFDNSNIPSGTNEDGDVTESALNINLAANPYNNSRTGTIYVYCNGNRMLYLNITQGIASTSVDVTSLSMPRNASTQKVTLSSDVAWKAFTSAATATKGETASITQIDWFDVSPNHGEANKQDISINTTDNTQTQSRVGYVIITNEANIVQDVIRVEQEKSFLSRADENGTLSIDMRGGDLTANISSNTEWYLYTAPDWVEVKPTTGKGNAKLTFAVKKNETGSDRSGTVILLPQGMTSPVANANPNANSDVQAKFTIIQSGPSISIDNANISFDGNGGEQSIYVKADAPWSLNYTDGDWLTVTPTSGTGDGSVTLTAQANNTRAARSATINLEMAGQTKTITVAQASKYINLTQSAMEFDSHSGTWKISVKSSSTWTVNIDSDCASWVTATDQSGTGDKDITLTIADNASANARSGKVEITLDDGQVVVATIAQKGRYMRLPFSTAQLFAKGGSKDVEIDTDGQLAYEQTGNWFTITPLTNGAKGYTITASENTTKAMREGSVRFYLTDLTDGTTVEATLRIIQAPEGTSFTIEGYGDDNNFNGSSSHGNTTITIGGGYTDDADFN